MGKYDGFFKTKNPDDGYLYCCVGYCKSRFKKQTDASTSHLRKHMSNKHAKALAEHEEELSNAHRAKINETSRQLKRTIDARDSNTTNSVDSDLESPPTKIIKKESTLTLERSFSGECALQTERAIAQFIAIDCRPMSIMDSPGFKNLISVLAPEVKIKSRSTYARRIIPTLFDEYERRVRDVISNAQYVSFTADAWSSSENRHSLFCLTANFLNTKTFKSNFVVLGVMPLKGPHTGKHLGKLISSCLPKFGIDENKRHVLVRDGAASMVTASRVAGLPSVQCFANLLQLAIKDGLSKVSGKLKIDLVIEKMKKIVRKTRKSGDKLVEVFELLNLPPRTLIKDIEMRWKSLCYMVKRFMDSKQVIQTFLLNASDNRYPELSNEEWTVMNRLCHLLEPLANVIDLLQAKDDAPISIVIPTWRVLAKSLHSLRNDEEVGQACIEIRNSLNSRMENYCDGNKYAKLATILDPRFKDSFFQTSQKELLLSAVHGETFKVQTEEIRGACDSDDLPAASMNLFAAYLRDEGHRLTQSTDLVTVDIKNRASLEVTHYLSIAPNMSNCPRKFWSLNDNKLKYPILHSLALQHFTCPATSCESERALSAAGLITTDLCKTMSVETLEKLLFLKFNIPILGFSTSYV